ncbi:MAG: M23 family metallopeptidase [Gammaproteobacteria bacterium]|nr:M23 family metallopeptidase [Gammaproteobacteria bacterium]
MTLETISVRSRAASRWVAAALALWLGAAAADSLVLDGPLVQGGLVVGRTLPGARVELDGRAVRVSAQGVFLVGFDRDALPQALLEVELPDGTRERRELAVRARSYDIQRIDGLPPRQVTPSAEDLERIRREIALVKAARARDDARTDFLGGFQWPASGRITGVYGSQRILNGEPRRPHYGVDVAAPVGTEVVAPAAGVVTLTHDDMFFSGGTLIVDHGHGLSSSFLHLSEILVEEGDRVEQGQPIARIGASGRVTGAHLDWRMNLGDARVDPQLLVGPMAR